MTDKNLRKCWSTGACATAATVAAFKALVTGHFTNPVSIKLPKGREPSFALSQQGLGDGFAHAGIIKDAGDDPDVTHGAEIISTVWRTGPGEGITFKAGQGVGMVTKPGLPIPPGEPAINPAPRKMMIEAVTEIAKAHNVPADLEITLSIPGGEKLALETLNGRLGILGGLSILGTTGVVTPYSCAAWISAIHRGVDVAKASGLKQIAACTGSTSEKSLQALLDLPEEGFIDMGDFIGGLLKYLRREPVEKLTLGGGFAKLCKLAQGDLNLHSKESRVDFTALSATYEGLGGEQLPESVNSAMEVLELATAANIPLADAIADKAREVALESLPQEIKVEVFVFDRQGKQVGHG